jgi:hypothetical protein
VDSWHRSNNGSPTASLTALYWRSNGSPTALQRLSNGSPTALVTTDLECGVGEAAGRHRDGADGAGGERHVGERDEVRPAEQLQLRDGARRELRSGPNMCKTEMGKSAKVKRLLAQLSDANMPMGNVYSELCARITWGSR